MAHEYKTIRKQNYKGRKYETGQFIDVDDLDKEAKLKYNFIKRVKQVKVKVETKKKNFKTPPEKP